MVFLTNHFELPPMTIAALYKNRWHVELFFLPNFNLIERLWKFVKKDCLYSTYYNDFALFKQAISSCLAQTGKPHTGPPSISLLSHRFRTFKKSKIMPG